MNITLSAEPEVLQRTREYARNHGTSLNQLVREFLQRLTMQEDRDKVADEFVKNATEHGGQSPEGFRFRRDQAQRLQG
jgi:hypothetical protein